MLDENNETRLPAVAAPGDQRRAGAGNQPRNALGPQLAIRPNPLARINPLGFIGRLFGIANPAQGNNIPQLNNVNGQQPGIFINYQVQYQFPRRQNENNQLQATPPFAGFPGPGGVWQPWPAQDGDQLPPTATPTPADTPHTDESPVSGTVPSSSQNTSQLNEDLPSARDAARQAALRRFGGQVDVPQPEASTPKSTPTATPTTSTSPSIGLRPPQLIPLFDFRDFAGPLHPEASTHVQGLDINSNRGSTQNTTIGHDSTATTPTSSRVPRRLTEDQLAQLDTLTRESIDLRLRILDGISATLNECIDDLMELRSALPPPIASGVSDSPPPMMSASAGSKEGENPVDNKGKGREKSNPAGEEPGVEAVQLEGVDY